MPEQQEEGACCYGCVAWRVTRTLGSTIDNACWFRRRPRRSEAGGHTGGVARQESFSGKAPDRRLGPRRRAVPKRAVAETCLLTAKALESTRLQGVPGCKSDLSLDRVPAHLIGSHV